MLIFKANMQPYMNAETDTGSPELDYDLDLSDTEDTPTEVETEEVTETQEEAKEEPAPDTTPRIKVKFNHEERELGHEEAIPLIQKGMNYDKLQEKIQAFENDPRLMQHGKMKQLADSYGMAEDEFLDALQTQYFEATADSQGLTPAQVKRDYELRQREQSLVQKEQSSTKQQQDDKMYSTFTSNFPDVKADSISPDTWMKVEKGMDLTTAYVQQQNAELQAQIKALKQNETNSKRSPVKSTTAHGSKEIAVEDPFLGGFDSI